jgi:hypothetical protein
MGLASAPSTGRDSCPTECGDVGGYPREMRINGISSIFICRQTTKLRMPELPSIWLLLKVEGRS